MCCLKNKIAIGSAQFGLNYDITSKDDKIEYKIEFIFFNYLFDCKITNVKKTKEV